MGKSKSNESECGEGHYHGGGSNLASSCVIGAIFLIFLFLLSLVLYFTLLKPRDPTLAVNAVNLPSFSVLNSSASFTLSQYLALHNPNRLALFTHYDTSLRLLTGGGQQQLGVLMVPAGQIGPGRTQYMAATFSAVKTTDRELHLLELETRLEMAGHLHLLRIFTHRVEVWAYCRVLVSAADGSVLSFHC